MKLVAARGGDTTKPFAVDNFAFGVERPTVPVPTLFACGLRLTFVGLLLLARHRQKNKPARFV